MEGDLAERVDVVVTISDVEAEWFRQRGARTVHVHDPFPERCEASDWTSPIDATPSSWPAGSLEPRAPTATGSGGSPMRCWSEPSWVGRRGARHRVEPARRAGSSGRRTTSASSARSTPSNQPSTRRRSAVVPIRYGAGVKIKAIDVLSRGVPVVATTIGAEGIPAPWRAGMLIEDDPARFAAALASVLGDEVLVLRSLRDPLVA